MINDRIFGMNYSFCTAKPIFLNISKDSDIAFKVQYPNQSTTTNCHQCTSITSEQMVIHACDEADFWFLMLYCMRLKSSSSNCEHQSTFFMWQQKKSSGREPWGGQEYCTCMCESRACWDTLTDGPTSALRCWMNEWSRRGKVEGCDDEEERRGQRD